MVAPAQNLGNSTVWHRWRLVVLVLAAVLSGFWGWLALPVAFATFIGAITLDTLRAQGAFRPGLCILVSALVSSAALTRFVVVEGMSGIVKGGRQAVQRKAVSRLREILFAQDAMRRLAWIDPDADGIGSAPFLDELCGGTPQRGQSPANAPVLRCSTRGESLIGTTSAEGAYRFIVCVPTQSGGWTANDAKAVDEERAEHEFIAYAWPGPGSSFRSAFFIDARENILTRGVPSEGVLASSGPWEPTCGEAVDPKADSPWGIWRGKKPRE